MFYDRHVVHHAGRLAVDVLPGPEGIQDPLFTGEPCEHSGFDGREVRDHEPAPLRRDEGRPDQLREHEGGLPVKGLHGVEVSLRRQVPGEIQVRQGIPGEVVRLHDPPGPPAGPIGPIKLQDPTKPVILTDGLQHGAVLCHAGLPEGLPDLQHPPGRLRQVFPEEQRVHVVLPELPHRDPALIKPGFQLGEAVRVLQSRNLPGLFLQPLPVLFVMANDLLDHRDVKPHPVVVHPLVQLPELLFALRERVPGELLPDRHLGNHVLAVVLDVECPLDRVMLRQVSGPAAVRLRGLAWLGEVPDQALADRVLQLLLREAQGDAGACQRPWQAALQRHDHRVAPLLRRHLLLQFLGEARPLEGGIPGPLLDVRIREGVQELPGPAARLGAVMHLHRAAVDRVADQQDLEVRVFHVSVDTAGGEVCAAVCLDVNADPAHSVSPSRAVRRVLLRGSD